MPVCLIAGLGNPGQRYESTRHNVGFWFVDRLARMAAGVFRNEPKFAGELCDVRLHDERLKLLKPQTFMNASGRSVAAVANYYNFEPETILVVHDEIDIPAGQLRFKSGGGHGGHNGLRDIVSQLGSAAFLRLRIGVGHPGQKEQVHGHVLKPPGKDELSLIEASLDKAQSQLQGIFDGQYAAVMNNLHRRDRAARDDETA